MTEATLVDIVNAAGTYFTFWNVLLALGALVAVPIVCSVGTAMVLGAIDGETRLPKIDARMLAMAGTGWIDTQPGHIHVDHDGLPAVDADYFDGQLEPSGEWLRDNAAGHDY